MNPKQMDVSGTGIMSTEGNISATAITNNFNYIELIE